MPEADCDFRREHSKGRTDHQKIDISNYEWRHGTSEQRVRLARVTAEQRL